MFELYDLLKESKMLHKGNSLGDPSLAMSAEKSFNINRQVSVVKQSVYTAFTVF